MAITIDWGTQIINVPQADLTFISGNLYELDVDAFRLTLKDLEDDEEGIVFPRTHNHNTEVVIGGVTYARFVEIINGYTVTFENGAYRINTVGANHNISDVLNLNTVQLVVNNSAGLISAGTALSAAETLQLDDIHKIHGLDTNTDLEVSSTQRTAGGGIVQDITEPISGTTRVRRQ